MATMLIEVIRQNKGGSFTTYHSFVAAEHLPVPSVGDSIVVWKRNKAKVIKIDRRLFSYTDSGLYLQLFFTKTN
jgi:hypothetical protein